MACVYSVESFAFYPVPYLQCRSTQNDLYTEIAPDSGPPAAVRIITATASNDRISS